MSFIIANSRVQDFKISNRVEKKINEKIYYIYNKKELNIVNLKKIKPKLIFFVHWSFLIPEEIFSKYVCIVFHMTDLPFGRGGSPLQNLIVRGLKKTKISALKCVKEIDAGPIYLKEPLSLKGTAEEILSNAEDIIEEMIFKIISDKSLKPKIQKGETTYFKRRSRDDGNIQKLQTLDEIFDFIRMLDANGYPNSFIDIENFRLEFSKAILKNNSIVAQVQIKRLEKKINKINEKK